LLYGVGNAFWQNFTVALPNFVGGMSLGFNSYEDDAPAWGNNAVFPYKEMWVYSSCRMAINFSRVGAGARVKGTAPTGAEFRHLRTGKVTHLRPGRFDLQLDAGGYAVRYGAIERKVTVADGTSLDLSLDPQHTAVLSANSRPTSPGRHQIDLLVSGAGTHELKVRSWNAVVSGPKQVTASGKASIYPVSLEVADQTKPWIVVFSTASEPDNFITISGK
jgi:hypothetical protein